MSQFTDFQYDVFLSHNQADKPRVRQLAERLRAAGLRQNNFEFRASGFGFPPQAAWVGLERSTVGRGNLPFREPANAGRRFISLHPSAPHRLSPEKTR